MVRRTSIDAYNRIRASGLLNRRQMQVYDALYEHGPLTENELHVRYFPDLQPRSIQPRVNELKRRGVVECVGVRACQITGNACMAFDVTDQLPIEPPKTPSTRQLLQAALAKIEQLEADVAALKTRPWGFGQDGQARFA